MQSLTEMEKGETYNIIFFHDIRQEPKKEKPYYNSGVTGFYRGTFAGRGRGINKNDWIFKNFKLQGDPSEGETIRIRWPTALQPRPIFSKYDPSEENVGGKRITRRKKSKRRTTRRKKY